MLTKILMTRVPLYLDLVRDTLVKSIPNCNEELLQHHEKELLLGLMEMWASHQEGKIDGVVLTKISDSPVLGGRMLTIVATYSPTGTSIKSFQDGYDTLIKYGRDKGCKAVDFYTSNPHIIKYAKQFPIDVELQYYQLKIGEV